jgi:hypothetical protein
MTKRKSGRKSYDDFDDFDDFEAYSDFGEFGDEDTFIPDDDAEDPDTGWGYYTDYETPPEAIILNGPFHAVARRGKFGASWWGRQWVTAMEAHDRDGRLDRGRSYARHGNVKRLEISHGQTFAKVQGSRPAPYLTRVYLRPFTDEEWRAALTALAAQAIYAAKLLAGEMPSDIETVFNGVNLSLFPHENRRWRHCAPAPRRIGLLRPLIWRISGRLTISRTVRRPARSDQPSPNMATRPIGLATLCTGFTMLFHPQSENILRKLAKDELN